MCPSEGDRRQAGQRSVRAVMVVAVSPVLGHPPDFVQTGEDIAVEYLGTQRTVEAFYQCVLRGLAGLDMHEFDAMPFGPVAQSSAGELRAVVQAKPARRASQFDQSVERTDHACRRQAGVDLDLQAFAIEVVGDVEGAEATPRSQRIGHEGGRPRWPGSPVGPGRDRTAASCHGAAG